MRRLVSWRLLLALFLGWLVNPVEAVWPSDTIIIRLQDSTFSLSFLPDKKPAEQDRSWAFSTCWAFSWPLREGLGLDLTYPAELDLRIDALDGEQAPGASKTRDLIKISWEPDDQPSVLHAPRPRLISLASDTNHSLLATWLAKQFYPSQASELGEALFSTLRRSRAGLNERLAWLHQSLIAGAEELRPVLLPSATRETIYSTADYARDFLQISRKLGLKASLAVPLSPKSSLPLGSLGVLIDQGGRLSWYFPASRVYPALMIPWYLVDLEVLLIDESGRSRKTRLLKNESGRFNLNLKCQLTNTAKLQAELSLEASGIEASDLRARILDQGREGFLNQLVKFENLSSLAVRHLLQLQSPLRLDASFTAGLDLDQVFGLFDREYQARLIANRFLDLTERIEILIPPASALLEVPLDQSTRASEFESSIKWTKIPGGSLSKPKHWSQSDWERWLKTNPAQNPDRLIRERKLRVKATLTDSQIGDLIAFLSKQKLPVIRLKEGQVVK